MADYRARCLASLANKGANRPSPTSVVRHLAAVRAFLRFARFTGQLHLTDEVIRFILKSPRAEVRNPYQVLSDEERPRLIAATKSNARDHILLLLVVATGVRASEVCALRVGDLIVAGYLHQSGLNDKTISPHSLRHGAAIAWLRSGASAVEVQKLLGHASLSTTQKYVDHLEVCDLKKVVNRRGTARRMRQNQA
ncbi:MAG: tyrosine-type recombinase/integrase [Chloroflexi bacterium]|nr:tyrosine-type recombinase/integrase [Chloroflexota bacterium]